MLQTAFTKALNVVLLQGHQNVGELRPMADCYLEDLVKLQGHQNVGELRLNAAAEQKPAMIAGSPECW